MPAEQEPCPARRPWHPLSSASDHHGASHKRNLEAFALCCGANPKRDGFGSAASWSLSQSAC